jgi:hypothetical protein
LDLFQAANGRNRRNLAIGARVGEGPESTDTVENRQGYWL